MKLPRDIILDIRSDVPHEHVLIAGMAASVRGRLESVRA
jgi:hypothetical protein